MSAPRTYAAWELGEGLRPNSPEAYYAERAWKAALASIAPALATGFPLEGHAKPRAPGELMITDAGRAVLTGTSTHATDARAVAISRGLKIWNGAIRTADAFLKSHHDPSRVHVYACAKSRADLLRMTATYQGLPGPERLQVSTQPSW